MTDEELDEALKAIGKEAFVVHYMALKACAEPLNRLEDELAEYDRKLARRPISASTIFRYGREGDALRIIASSRVPEAVQSEAKELLRQNDEGRVDN